MEITIKAAAEMAKVSRTTIYNSIKNGKLSRCPSGRVETSEVLRVFGNPGERCTRGEQTEHMASLQKTLNTTLNTEREELYKTQIKTLEETLRQAQEREQQYIEREVWQRGQIDKLTDTVKQLEAPKTNPSRQERLKEFIDRFLGK